MKLIIAGGRDFYDYSLMKSKLDNILETVDEEIEIVSGTANGADKLGEQYAQEKGFPIKKFPADWDKYKKRAGYMRNKQMAEYATHCVCFWNGKSKGTAMMIDLAKEFELSLRVIKY